MRDKVREAFSPYGLYPRKRGLSLSTYPSASEWTLLVQSLGKRPGIASEEVRAHLSTYGALAGAPGVSEHARDLFATALSIEPRLHQQV